MAVFVEGMISVSGEGVNVSLVIIRSCLFLRRILPFSVSAVYDRGGCSSGSMTLPFLYQDVPFWILTVSCGLGSGGPLRLDYNRLTSRLGFSRCMALQMVARFLGCVASA